MIENDELGQMLKEAIRAPYRTVTSKTRDRNVNPSTAMFAC